jgi:hypothetical protein
MSISRSTRVNRLIFALCSALVSGAALTAALPAAAGAYATVAQPPNPSTNSGLPDGRVYEQVSPVDKHGFPAGATNSGEATPLVFATVASADGNAVAFGGEGPAAETDSSGENQTFVAQRTLQGWRSRSSTARGLGLNEGVNYFSQNLWWLDYSPDLSHLAYGVEGPDVKGAPPAGSFMNLYLSGPDTLEEPVWLARPAGDIPERSEARGYGGDLSLVGMTPDAKTVYFMNDGPLFPGNATDYMWHLYEYRDGVLKEAGVLPDGSVPAGGALPVALFYSGSFGRKNTPTALDNEVSEDGRRVFFAASNSGPLELYVHEIEADGTEKSVLVSASQVPGHVGEATPDGVSPFANPAKNTNGGPSIPTLGYASPDGSHVFFQSTDPLTAAAPNDASPKAYVFDVDTASLEYLPGVAFGGIVTAARDGSSFVFVNEGGPIPELDTWTAGPNGGSVSQIVQLPGGGFVGPGYLAGGGSTLVFQASAPIAGFNNAGSEQVYRYDAKTDEVSCLSCSPAGIPPRSAYLSANDEFQNYLGASGGTSIINDARGPSADGNRVFFSTSAPLVPQDTNGLSDVYEWENGNVFLISPGSGPDNSMLLDNGASGADVFFTTTAGLVPGDTDGGFDVYDARIPHPGDNPPPSGVPCQGDVCQGPLSTPQLFGAPASATFSGVGNLAPASPPTHVTTKKAVKCRKGFVKNKKGKCIKKPKKQSTKAKKAGNNRRGK